MKIDWSVTVDAFALLGYEFKLPQGFEDLSAERQMELWDAFLRKYMRCELHCAWKGGGPCILAECPRHVLRRVSLNALPLTRGICPGCQASGGDAHHEQCAYR